LMIGRTYDGVFPPKPAHAPRTDAPRLAVRELAWNARLKDISLELHAGEIVGLGGLDGQGQRELLLALFGVMRGVTGEVLVDGRPTTIGGPGMAKRADIGMA